MIGKTLGTFECTALLGKGGMGEVYKAKDQKLGRDVAIKVLPEEFAKDADRVARFQREAKLLASLNHPNIAAIHGLEESDGTHFLVLELIEGDTLADQIKGGPIPVEETLKLALQIAEALEAAHDKGVIHRDLKPANIKVTPDGKIKVLDFGLAKAFAGEQAEVNLSNSPTLSVAATQQGIILGTAAYMSPEQASGEATDKRTDIWAFGVVLFEMLTGRSLFEGNNISQTLASVIKSEPEWQTLPPNLHPRIRLLLERCLEKEPRNRYSGIADARVDIQKVLKDPGGVFGQAVTTAKPQKKLRVGISWVGTALILGLIIAGVAVWMLKPAPLPEPKQVTRFEYELPKGQQFSSFRSAWNLLTVSPDGSKFVYSTTKGLFLRSMDEFGSGFIAGTDGTSSQPFFSPDGKWIGYWSGTDQKLKKVAVSGGVPVTLCDVVFGGGFSWSLDNRILHSEGENIMWISANGGNWEQLIRHENGLLGIPQMLPGGEAVMYLNQATSPYTIMVQSLKSGETKELLQGALFAQYVKTGHIVYGVEKNLYAVRFDSNTLEVKGIPIPVVESVSNTTDQSNYAISDTGTLVYVPADSATFDQRTFVWVDRQGKEQSLGAGPSSYYEFFKISPDGTRVAFSTSESGNQHIWIWDLERNNKSRLTFSTSYAVLPIWTPDSKRVIFVSWREGRNIIFWKAADGTGDAEKLASMPDRNITARSISSDGKTLFFDESGGEFGNNIGMLSMEGDLTPKMLLQKGYDEDNPQISPDGKWLAYESNESGRREVYLRPFPDVEGSGKWQISANGGECPVWSPNGKELYYLNPDAIMAVPVETEPTLKLGTPINLFPNKYIGQFNIHPDGKRFLMLRQTAAVDGESTEEITPKINIVLNWFEELKERVRVD